MGAVHQVDQANADATLQAISSSLTSSQFYATMRQGLNTTAKISQVRLDTYETRGPATNTSILVLNLAGTGNGALPLQSCMVASLRSATPGRRGRGRMYLPAYALELSGHEMTAAVADDVATKIAAGFTAIRGSADLVGLIPCVASKVGGVARPIANVVVDTRVDIQRRRANRQTITASPSHGVT